ncbi:MULTISPECIES: efflux RND transporter periplasmic adaptor subunit [unclassified Parabacteroides]|uniref:efflux RND transporter periplasmic adaptor subunit n=1 Tax=unclassified Parabacteroides TaxID=2649774 RepID=UPI002473F05C|nr:MULTISPECIES: efflux RND transporter periplasmic adaptor subunit [unclassified Parabacteroides]
MTFKFLWDESREQVARYEIVTPRIGTVENTVVATGNIEPRNKILIKPQISGIINNVRKEAGESIQKGEIIANVKVTTEMGELNAAESRLRVAEINLNQIQMDFRRQQMLYNREVISRNEFEISEAAYRKAVEEQQNAKDALDIVKYGVAKRFSRISNTQIRSTTSGTVLNLPIKEGDYVIQSNVFNEGTTIAAVADMTDLIFRGSVDETEVHLLKNKMPVRIKIGAISDKVFRAYIEYIAPEGKRENGTVLYEIKATLHVPDSVLIRADYSANGEILIRRARNTILIPEASVEFSEGLTYVYVLTSEGKEQVFERRQVRVGLSDGVNIQIRKGISLDDKVRGLQLD